MTIVNSGYGSYVYDAGNNLLKGFFGVNAAYLAQRWVVAAEYNAAA